MSTYRVVIVSPDHSDAQVLAYGLDEGHALHYAENVRSRDFYDAAIDAMNWAKKNRPELAAARRRFAILVDDLFTGRGSILVLPIIN